VVSRPYQNDLETSSESCKILKPCGFFCLKLSLHEHGGAFQGRERKVRFVAFPIALNRVESKWARAIPARVLAQKDHYTRPARVLAQKDPSKAGIGKGTSSYNTATWCHTI
jgi:hypothetical protein